MPGPRFTPWRVTPRRFACATALATLMLLASPDVQAQTSASSDAAMLIADRVYMDGRDRIIAEGHVEALQGTSRLRAARVVFDQQTGALSIEGPITLTDAGGDTTVIADSGQLDRDMQNGLLRGARMMLGQQLQLASAQIARVDGRYSQLYKTTVSSCHVCQNGKPPLWQIRAERVVHDQQTQQLYFDKATLDVMGLPVFYLPYLRLPDPTQSRASGFLIPSIKRNSQLGTGLKLPYFLKIGDHRDLTLTPYVSNRTRTLEFAYRQAFATGALSLSGALSKDDIAPGPVRGYLEMAGKFYLPRDYELKFHVEAVGDDSYLTDYGYSDKDRLDSQISVSRARRDEWVSGALTYYHTLRPTENNATIPSIIGDASYEKRTFPSALGGELRLDADVHMHYRSSDLNTDSGDSDLITDGRDVARMTVSANWLRTWTLAYGLRAEVLGGLALDSFRTAQDLALPSTQTGVTPTTALTLRWPLQRVGARGVTQILEPVAQIAWSGGHALDVANDESTRVEFDEGNLLGLTRFAAPDRRERGWRGSYGVQWSRFDPSGWGTRLALGQVVQQDADASFSTSSGLAGRWSNMLVAGQIRGPGGWSITARGLFDNGLDVTKAEGRAAWLNDRAGFGASYVWLSSDPDEDRADVVSEWTLDGAYKVTDNWRASANIRYDIASDKTAAAGMGVTYSNECVDVTVAVDRSYTSSTVVTPSTDFSFTIGLRGFSAQTTGGSVQGTCRN